MQLNPLCAIYTITNTINGKLYVGSTVNYIQRWPNHRNPLRLQKHENIKLQRAWDKYGEDAFKFEVIEYVPDVTQRIVREQHWMDLLNSCKAGYNILAIAGSSLGRIVTQETREKIRAAFTPEKRAEISAKHIGKVMSEGARKKMSDLKKGKPQSAETVAKRKESVAKVWADPERRAKQGAAAQAAWDKKREGLPPVKKSQPLQVFSVENHADVPVKIVNGTPVKIVGGMSITQWGIK